MHAFTCPRIGWHTLTFSASVGLHELHKNALSVKSHLQPLLMIARGIAVLWPAQTFRDACFLLSRYDEVVWGFLVPELGALSIGKLTSGHIQAAYTKWATEGRRDGKPGGLSPRTRHHIHRILKAALGRAVEMQVIARNPADAFKKLSRTCLLHVCIMIISNAFSSALVVSCMKRDMGQRS